MSAVIFDLFGTLVDNFEPAEWRAAFARIAVHLGAEPEPFWDAWATTYRDRMEGRQPDDDHMFSATARAVGATPTTTRLAEATRMRGDFMRNAMRLKPDAVSCLDSIRGAGFDLALATDCTSSTPDMLDLTPLGAYFEVRAISAHLGVTKPHAAMYEHVLRGLGRAGDECWYVGDGNSEELVGAKRHGMTTVWVDNGDRQHHKERFVPCGDHTIERLDELPALLPAL